MEIASCPVWRTQRIRTVFALSLLLNAPLLLSQGRDSLVLIDQSELNRGTVTATAASVTFISAAGAINVDWKNIQSIRLYNKVIELRPSGQMSISDAILIINDSGKTVDLGSGNRAAVSAIKAIGEPSSGPACPGGAPGKPGFLLEKATLSAAILSATQHQQTYSGEVAALNNWQTTASGQSANPTAASCGSPYQRTFLDILPSYDAKKTGKAAPIITRNYGATLQHLFFLSSNANYAYVVGNWYHNNSLGLYLEQNYGAGVGATHGNLEVDVDLRFVGEHFYSPGVSTSLIGAGLKGSYDIPIGGKGVKLNLTEQFVPVFNRSRAWFSDGTAALNVPFTTQWSMTAQLFDNYLRNAPQSFRRNYLKTTIGVSYSPVSK
jgi:hypothetical protein